jgi:hypothetical protein
MLADTIIGKATQEMMELSERTLHSGGCLASAILIKRMLNKEGIACRIAGIVWDSSRQSMAKSLMRERKPVSASHVVVKIGPDLIDANGYYGKAVDFRLFLYTDEMAEISLAHKHYWNDEFDRCVLPELEYIAGAKLYELTGGVQDVDYHLRREELGLNA